MKRAEIGYWVLWHSLLKTEEILSFLKLYKQYDE